MQAQYGLKYVTPRPDALGCAGLEALKSNKAKSVGPLTADVHYL